MKKKLGFTLIELLAVIIVLGIIIGIMVPVTSKLMEKSKKKAFETGVSGYLNAAETDSFDRGGLINTYTLTNGNIIHDTTGEKITVSTESKENGKLEINNKGEVTGTIYSSDWCALIKITKPKIEIIKNNNNCPGAI